MTQDAAVRGLLRKAQDDLRRVEENWVDGVTMIGGRDAKTSLLATPSSLEGVKEQLDLAIHIIRVDQSKPWPRSRPHRRLSNPGRR